jgi:hypothetical protein
VRGRRALAVHRTGASHRWIADETGSTRFIFHREVIGELSRIGDPTRVVVSHAWYDGEHRNIMAHVVERVD